MKQPVSDETLTAYLDGELSAAETTALDAALSDDDLLQARLDALDVDRAQIAAAFNDVMAHAPKAPTIAPAPSQTLFKPAVAGAMAASVCLGLLIGTLVMGQNTQTTSGDWKRAVAQYQVLYVPETLALSAEDTRRSAANLPMLSTALGRDLAAAVTVDDLEFKRAQMLGLNGAPLVQIAYTSPAGIPFAICVTRVDSQDRAPQTETIEGLAAAHWISDGFGFLVIGGQDEALVTRVARDLSPRI